MTDEFTTEQLEAVLASIGNHLEIPAGPTERTGPVPADRGRRSERLLVAAAVVAVVVAAVVLVPSTRAAIADLFGIGSTRLEITGDEAADGVADGAELPHVAQGLTSITADQATAILGGAPPDTSGTALGSPQAIYRMPEGGVLLAWRDETATLWIRPGTENEIIIRKLIGSGEDVETVGDLGTDALIIHEAHLLQTPERLVAARRVLLWYDDDREYRLEADMAPARLIDIARSLP